jgi:hypothetical protein
MKEILADIKSKLQSGDCSNEEHVRLSLVAREMGSNRRAALSHLRMGNPWSDLFTLVLAKPRR